MTVAPKQPAAMALAAHFPERTEAQWRELVAGVVNKGRPEGEHLGPDDAVASMRTHLEGGLTLAAYTLPADSLLGGPPHSLHRAARSVTPPSPGTCSSPRRSDPSTRLTVLADLDNGSPRSVSTSDHGLAPPECRGPADVRRPRSRRRSSWDDQIAAPTPCIRPVSSGRARQPRARPLGAAAEPRAGDLPPWPAATAGGHGDSGDHRRLADHAAPVVSHHGSVLSLRAWPPAHLSRGVTARCPAHRVPVSASAASSHRRPLRASGSLGSCGREVGVPRVAWSLHARSDLGSPVIRATMTNPAQHARHVRCGGGRRCHHGPPFDTVPG